MLHNSLTPRPCLHRRRKYDDEVSPLLLRVSVGLEELEHLKADLERGILAVS